MTHVTGKCVKHQHKYKICVAVADARFYFEPCSDTDLTVGRYYSGKIEYTKHYKKVFRVIQPIERSDDTDRMQ
jgi:hypothetical protein